MPELPDITIYAEALQRRIRGERFEKLLLKSPFLLRSVTPRPAELEGALVQGVGRLGKRIVVELEGDRFFVLHLMVAGRLHWHEPDDEVKMGARNRIALFRFSSGQLLLTEAGTKKRASLHLVAGREALSEHDRGGLEVLDASLDQFARSLTAENHTLKRSLTDPRILSGIGNSYSDEILHRAKLSPMRWTTRLDEAELQALYNATRAILIEATERLRAECGDGFPKKVTAFRPEMAVHGKFGKPCPVCQAPVQRIVYAENEANYCANCQTGGKLLADRALSRLLKKDWPRTLQELEEVRGGAGQTQQDAS